MFLFVSLCDVISMLMSRVQLHQLWNVNKEGGQHVLIFGNIRPTQPAYNRLVRTNINYRPTVSTATL